MDPRYHVKQQSSKKQSWWTKSPMRRFTRTISPLVDGIRSPSDHVSAAVSIGRKVNGLRIHVKHGCCSLACILAIARRGGMIPVTAARNVSPRMKSVPASPREIPRRHAPWDSASVTGSKIRSSMATSMSKADKSPAPPKPNRIYSAPSKLHGKP
ncbi:hypothetical protein HYQ44_017215 [Verticillium longisporum]|nr:hypothetical protein HYQ44_017215 [Verticillium longisporum]